MTLQPSIVMNSAEDVSTAIATFAAQQEKAQRHRVLIAVAGAPGSGKSTIAAAIAEMLGSRCCLIPMDGFHLDNSVLEERGLLPKKGAPETFDLEGFNQLILDLKHRRANIFPGFDRAADCVIEHGGIVPADADILLFEGNYLLFDELGWSDLSQHWDASLWLEVTEGELEKRLIQRWLDHGLPEDQARLRARGNDLVNAKRVIDRALPSTWRISNM